MKLNLDQMTKRYGDHVVLDAIDLHLSDIRSLVLIGPSGGGKTTMLRILAGLEQPEEGRVRVNDHDLRCSEAELLAYRRRIGMVYQAYNLFPHLNALENIMLPLVQVQGIEKHQAKEEALALLERFNLAEHAFKKPVALSGGQQQRIAICRAVAIKPEVLFFDEPTSALDPEYTSEVLDLIEELREEDMELILVTHEMGFAHKASDYVLFISDGGIVVQGTPAEVFEKTTNPRVQRFFNKVLKYN
ncbi:MAG: amino acid ABC transporter ATP-binding protein [Spirochaetia bacterium]|nr:amino acid ABC transporter ATP-binding protein [Spirochaetia bacterium]MCF7942222.1 amino acid ABC transporter ATP-binding protein [Spirochaetia bacterium]